MSIKINTREPDRFCPLCRRRLNVANATDIQCEEKEKSGKVRKWIETRLACTYCECVTVLPSDGSEPVVECRWK